MKKSKLIALLQAIPGDPQVAVWNGFVEDYMLVGTVSAERQAKYDRQSIEAAINYQRHQQGEPPITQDEMDKRYAKEPWFFVEKGNEPKHLHKRKKSLVILDVRPRGLSVHDRLGTIHY